MTAALSMGMTNPQMTASVSVRGTIIDKKQVEVEVPADICFLLDVSGSMAGAPAAAMDAQLKWLLFDSELIHGNDYVQISTFNSDTQLLLKPTKRENLSHAQVNALNISDLPSGGTRLWDAMAAVIESRKTYLAQKAEKLALKEAVHRGKRPQKAFVMLVLTDGESSGDHRLMLARLKSIGQEVTNFHLHILGVHLNSKTEAILQEVVSANPKRCEFTNIVSGHGAVTDAIRDSFRTHFTKTITKVRHVMRSITIGSDHKMKVDERELSPNGHHIHRHDAGHHSLSQTSHACFHQSASAITQPLLPSTPSFSLTSQPAP
jgi:Mg-chelatase subunit ChlD